MRVVVSTSAEARLAAARRFIQAFPPSTELLVIGASRGAADDFTRAVARQRGATFGLHRFSLTELAARAAAVSAPSAQRAPASQAGAEAIAARAVFEARAARALAYFDPVASMPGFPKALARTLHEVRLAGISGGELAAKGRDGPARAELARLLEIVEAQLDRAAVDDRAALFGRAAEAVAAGQLRWATCPMVLLDLPLDSRAEQAFVGALGAQAVEVLATAPAGDEFAEAALIALGAKVEVVPDTAAAITDLANLRRYVFTHDRPAARRREGDVRLFSAPGEGRESVEIVRRVLDEARRGVPFDEMAVLLRTPTPYLGLIEHACARGEVPVYFDRGTARPDPAGRAFVALLSCAVEGLSAKRFDEYLSLGQVPRIGGSMPATDAVAPLDEALGVGLPPASLVPAGLSDSAVEAIEDSDAEAVVSGTLRAPWKWEALVVESAVIGGRSRAEGRERWRRRLDGLSADYRYRLDALRAEEPESPRIARFERELRNLGHLRDFALPIVALLAEWPEQAMWGEWIDRFSVLAVRVLGRPARVQRTLADLRPMAEVGPVTLDEARAVLHDRLVTLDAEPPARRYGRLFVGTPHQARGRSFRVVFVPGLAERIVPQRPREDPLLLDEARESLAGAAGRGGEGLVRQVERSMAERLLLRMAIGTARERLYVSFPRLDVAETRARVPSFYALDIMRAITGTVPDHRVLAAEAADEGGATLAWPAPRDPDRAIDDLEHDLATLKPLLETRDKTSVKGRAHYLLGLNDALKRSVVSRWARGRPSWSTSDGPIRIAPGTRTVLEAHRLSRRPYSLSALQRFASCPYQFLLSTILRLEPWEEPEALVRLDPLTRGSLFHRVQAEFYRAMQARGALPIRKAGVAAAVRTLDGVLDRVAAEYEDDLAPAIDRVWRGEIDEIRRDLSIWVQRIADDATWVPRSFEFAFGLGLRDRDPESLTDPVVIDGRFVLHGSVDLIEERADGALRVTDHKTGVNRSSPDLIVGGGKVLQPVLYSLAIEQGLKRPVVEGRLFYSTTAGGFGEHCIPIDEHSRRQGLDALTIVDRAVEQGMLAAAPDARACTWCDFRPICGPREEERTGRKAKDKLADLQALRAMR
jgi:hypothetical protein